jgi:hypothetical protein
MFKVALVAVTFAGLLCSCDPLTAGSGTTPPPSSDTAWINITNQAQKDPGAIIFFFYAATAPDVNAVPARTIGTIKQDSTKTFPVPTGNWKLAIEDASGTMWPMLQGIGTSDWSAVHLGKDGIYNVIISTDAGNNNIWSSNIPLAN